MATDKKLAPSPIEQSRFFRSRSGVPTEEIARQDGVSQRTVESSIQRVDAFRQANSLEALSEALYDSVLKNKPEMDESINSALKAKRLVKNPETGAFDVVPDYRVQLKAVDKLLGIAKTVQPKAGNITRVSVGVGVGVRSTENHYLGFEERLRMIRAAMAAPGAIEAKAEVNDSDPAAKHTP